MDPNAKKWVLITLIAFGTLSATAYLSFFHGQNSALKEAKQQLQKSIDSLDKKSDSVQRLYDSALAVSAYLFRRIDTLNGRDSIIKNLLRNVNTQLIITQDKYARLKYIDAYNSDSLKKYFSDNFDSLQKK